MGWVIGWRWIGRHKNYILRNKPCCFHHAKIMRANLQQWVAYATCVHRGCQLHQPICAACRNMFYAVRIHMRHTHTPHSRFFAHVSLFTFIIIIIKVARLDNHATADISVTWIGLCARRIVVVRYSIYPVEMQCEKRMSINTSSVIFTPKNIMCTKNTKYGINIDLRWSCFTSRLFHTHWSPINTHVFQYYSYDNESGEMQCTAAQ